MCIAISCNGLNSRGCIPLWQAASGIAFGIVVGKELFGGGLAIAQGFQSSGLATWIAQNMVQLEGFSVFLILLDIVI